MNRLDELAGWAAANEDVLREFVDKLDELVADQVPAAIELADRVRAGHAVVWDEGHDGDEHGPGLCECVNPYERETGESDGS